MNYVSYVIINGHEGPLLIETQRGGLEIAFNKNGVGHGEEKGFFSFSFSFCRKWIICLH